MDMKDGNLTIKRRVIITVTGIFLASTALMGFFAYRGQVNQVRNSFRDMAKNESKLFQSILKGDADGLARAHTGLTKMDRLLGLFAAGKREELLAAAKPIFDEIKQNNNITHMYFIQPDGTAFLRVHKPQQFDDKVNRATFKNAAATNKVSAGIEMGKNFFSLRSVHPVSYSGKPIGYMEIAEEIDHVFQQMKEITGNDVSIFLTDDFLKSHPTELKSEKSGNFSIIYPTNKEIALKLATKLGSSMTGALKEPAVSMLNLNGAKYVVAMSPVQDAAGETVGVLLSQKDVTALYSGVWKGIIANIVTFAAILLGSSAFLFLSLRKSLLLFEELKRHILGVTTTWDLTRQLKVDTRDEIGEMGNDFNAMTLKLAEMVGKTKKTIDELGRISRNILDASKSVVSAAELQASGSQETSSAVIEINASTKGIAGGVDSLSQSSSETSSSILEMAASVEEVVMNVETLSQSVDEVSSSIMEMAASLRQIDGSVANLLEASTRTASSVAQMDGSIKQVEHNAKDAAAISSEVLKDAETGKKSVEATIAGIAEIKRSSGITAEVIATLSEKAGDIGAILSVIDEVAGQTNLLALNAAIIAAQAGEHGKGFAVVADEIKELADRTSSSTREISEVIKGVQNETSRAVAAITQAEKSITDGEHLSRNSGEALAKIVSGTKKASDQVTEIARATLEQAQGSLMIREAAEQVSEMVDQIARATGEQRKGSDLILSAAEKMSGLTAQVKNSTREQSSVGNLIAKSTENITDMIRRIKLACDEQSRGSEQILHAVQDIQESSGINLEAAKVMDDSVSSLSGQIKALESEMAGFKVTGGD